MKEIIIFSTPRKLNDLWAAILFSVITLSYFTIIYYCRSSKIIPVYSVPKDNFLDNRQMGVIRHLFIMFKRNYNFGRTDSELIDKDFQNKFTIPRQNLGDHTIDDENTQKKFNINTNIVVEHFYHTSNIIFILFLVFVFSSIIYLGEKIHVFIPSTLTLYALGCVIPRYNLENLILFFGFFYCLVRMSFDLHFRTKITVTMFKSIIRTIFTGLPFILPPFILSLYFMMYQLKLLTNTFIYSTEPNLPLKIFLIFYFIISLFVVLFTLGLYLVSVFFFLMSSFNPMSILKYSIMNVYYNFGTVCLYSMLYYYKSIRIFTDSTIRILMNSELTKKGIFKVIYTCLMLILVPVRPFLVLFTRESLDFIVCLGFYSRNFKKTNEKNTKQLNSPDFTRLKVFDVNNTLLGALAFCTVVSGYIYDDFVILYKLVTFTRVHFVLMMCRFLIFSYIISVVFNSFVGILHYMVIFKNEELEKYDEELYALFRSVRVILVVVF